MTSANPEKRLWRTSEPANQRWKTQHPPAISAWIPGWILNIDLHVFIMNTCLVYRTIQFPWQHRGEAFPVAQVLVGRQIQKET